MAIVAAANSLFAAGYQVQEQGASNMGTAMAGAVTNANGDASAAYCNPAAAFYSGLEVGETKMDIGVQIIAPTLDFQDNGSFPPSADNGASSIAPVTPVPNFYVTHKFTEDIIAGLSVTAPFGLESDYEDNWVGRYQALNSFVFTVDINPSIAYKVNDWLTIGGGLSAQYMYATLSNMLPGAIFGTGGDVRLKLNGSGWGVGGNLGFVINYMEGGRFGFTWRSAVNQQLDGTLRVGSIRQDISTEINNPDVFTFGIYQKFLKDFAVMADYSYIRWSEFESLTIDGFSLMGNAIKMEEQWKDTSRVSLGFHYYPDFWEGATFRIGAAFDETPIDKIRTARIPCGDRVWLSTGLGFQMKDVHFDLAYTYIMLVGNTGIEEASAFGTYIRGQYASHIHVVSAQVSFKF